MISYKTNSAILLFSLIFMIASSSLPEACSNAWIESQTCGWYLNCLQQKFQCGKSGYPVGYGFKYCNEFGQLKTYPQSREWIQKTTVCLKQKLNETLADGFSMSCHQLRNYAFETHPHCYQQAGFCKLWRELGYEKSAVFLRQLLGIFDAKDFESISALKQIEEMIKLCE